MREFYDFVWRSSAAQQIVLIISAIITALLAMAPLELQRHIINTLASTFTTLLAIINPLESLPVFLKLLEGKDEQTHRRVAWRACSYATLLLFFFLVFGTLLLKIFEVPLSMVRIVGGIILMRIGFSLFMPSGAGSSITSNATSSEEGSIAFVPLAMPLMFGPGAIATVLGMASLVRDPLRHLPSLRDRRRHPADDDRDLSVSRLCR